MQHSAHDGTGIDVALIDSGVSPVDGLDGPNLVHGPDVSDEGNHEEVAYLDTYGHGTHMAGIIAGTRAGHEGIAPGARVVSVKVAGADGETTVPQVVAAIDWVVEHHDSDGFNIRIVNLSLGQDDVDDHEGDLLSAAVERAWDAGILVVVAAGNRGTEAGHLDSPAIDPFVVAVGAVDNTVDEDDDEQPPTSFSSRGDGVRNPDLIAPGQSIVSYRVPGSTVDEEVPSARVGDDLFKGTGTSQAAAVVSGVAARIFGAHPSMTNDEVKETLTRTAVNDEFSPRAVGNGKIEGDNALRSPAIGTPAQNHAPAASEGSGIVAPSTEDTEDTWSSGGWSGATWSGATWSGATWSGATWSGATWSGAFWSAALWAGATWSGATWSGATWSGATWSGATWSGATWSGATWSGVTWSGSGWE